MNEEIVATVVRSDEAETLLGVKPLDGAFAPLTTAVVSAHSDRNVLKTHFLSKNRNPRKNSHSGKPLSSQLLFICVGEVWQGYDCHVTHTISFFHVAKINFLEKEIYF